MTSFLQNLYAWAGDPRSGEKKDVDPLPVIIPLKADNHPKKELYFENLEKIIDQQKQKIKEHFQNESKRLEDEKDVYSITEDNNNPVSQIPKTSQQPTATESKPKIGISLGKKSDSSSNDQKKDEKPKLSLSIGKKDEESKKEAEKPKLSLNIGKKDDETKKETEKPKLSLNIGQKKEETNNEKPKLSLNIGKKKEEEKPEENSSTPETTTEEKKEETKPALSLNLNSGKSSLNKPGNILKFDFGAKNTDDPNKPKLTAAGLKLPPPASSSGGAKPLKFNLNLKK